MNKNPIKLREEIESHFNEIGKTAFGDSSFEFIKWAPMLGAIMAFILPGMLFGPIGLAIAGVIGVTGHITFDKLMKVKGFTSMINKPKYALDLISQNKIHEAILEYKKILESSQKFREVVNGLSSLPPSLKKFILGQVGHEVSTNDFYVYESGIYYTLGVLQESVGASHSSVLSFVMSANSFPMNLAAIRKISESTFLKDKEVIKNKIIESANEKNIKIDVRKIEELFSQFVVFNDDSRFSLMQSYLHINDLKTAGLYACQYFEELVQMLNHEILNPPAPAESSIFIILENVELQNRLSFAEIDQWHKFRKIRNKIVHNDVISDLQINELVSFVNQKRMYFQSKKVA